MAVHVLDNAALWIGDGRRLAGHVVIGDGRLAAVAAGPYTGNQPAEDLHGAVLSPGLIDLMVLGGFGCSIVRVDPARLTFEYLRHGVTALQFCIGTLGWTEMHEVGRRVQGAVAQCSPDHARTLGLYAEGPFQQPELTGASLRAHALPPSAANVGQLLNVFGSGLRMVNIAPGLEGDVEAVRQLRSAGRVVSMAHSNAPAARVQQCLEAGTTVLGHAWDNNSGLIGDSGVQQPTLEHVAMLDDRVRFIHLISDGVHVAPLLIRLLLRCRGLDPICLVTDANIRSGCADGAFLSDDGRTWKKKGGVIRTEKDWLAGSALLLPDMFRKFVEMTGTAPHEAIATVTHHPAACAGLEREIGLLMEGQVADLVLWDERLRVRRVWRMGQEVSGVIDDGEVVL